MSIGASTGVTQGSYSAMSHFPTGFANGVSIQGTPVTMTNPGRVFWCDSVNGSDNNHGTFARPFKTISGALSKMAGLGGSGVNNDILYVKDGHAETITAANGIDINQAGLSIIGLGNGRRRPTITFTTSTAAAMRISAANVRLSGFRFVNGINSLVTMLNFTATDIMVDGCEFYEGASTTGLNFINTVNSSANQCDRLKIYGCSFLNPTSGNYVAAIQLPVNMDQVDIQGCYIRGNFSQAGIYNIVAHGQTNMSLGSNVVINLTSGKYACNLGASATTAQIWGNRFLGADKTFPGFTIFTQANASFGGNNFDQFGDMAAGSTFIVKKNIVSSTITTSAQTLFTDAMGDVQVENVILETDSTGLAGATNFRILSDNAFGAAAIVENAVSGLGANATVDIFTAAVAKQRTVIESGKHVQFLGTVGAGTGAGTINVTVVCRRAVPGAVIYG